MIMDAKRSSLLLVDVQENLAPVMADARSVYRGCGLLLRTAARLAVPVIASEQYPKGLGSTVGELAQLLPEGAAVEKIHFACSNEPAITDRLAVLGRDQVVLAGIEAHVCVLQSALGLKEKGYQVFVVSDACSSRLAANHQAAMQRLAANGIGIVTVEMVMFEWLHRAGTPEFKDMVALIR